MTATRRSRKLGEVRVVDRRVSVQDSGIPAKQAYGVITVRQLGRMIDLEEKGGLSVLVA